MNMMIVYVERCLLAWLLMKPVAATIAIATAIDAAAERCR